MEALFQRLSLSISPEHFYSTDFILHIKFNLIIEHFKGKSVDLLKQLKLSRPKKKKSCKLSTDRCTNSTLSFKNLGLMYK